VISFLLVQKKVRVLVSAKYDEHHDLIPSSLVSGSEIIEKSFPIFCISAISPQTISNPISSTAMSNSSSILGILEKIINKYKIIPFVQLIRIKTGTIKLIPFLDQVNKMCQILSKEEIEVGLNMKINKQSQPLDSIISYYLKLLEEMKYISQNELNIKGKIGRLICYDDPILLIELLFLNFFSNRKAEDCLLIL
jgi:hypothetical protein